MINPIRFGEGGGDQNAKFLQVEDFKVYICFKVLNFFSLNSGLVLMSYVTARKGKK